MGQLSSYKKLTRHHQRGCGGDWRSTAFG